MSSTVPYAQVQFIYLLDTLTHERISEWINESMKWMPSLPNHFGLSTSYGLSNPFWFLVHCSTEIALSKFVNGPFITKPCGLGISVASYQNFPWNSLHYWFLGEYTNLISLLDLWSSLLCLFLWPSSFTQFLICLLRSRLFKCYRISPSLGYGLLGHLQDEHLKYI